jgi:hypothetical protein
VRSQLAESPPFLTSVVVLSSGTNAGLPDKGVSDVWPGYESLSKQEKAAKLAAELRSRNGTRPLSKGKRASAYSRFGGNEPCEASTVSSLTSRWLSAIRPKA